MNSKPFALFVLFVVALSSTVARAQEQRPYERLECLHYGRDYRNPCNPPPPAAPDQQVIVVPFGFAPSFGGAQDRPQERPQLRDMHRHGIKRRQ